MTALTNKQRVQINTALAIVHASGHNASDITTEAKAYQLQGHSHVKAYEYALSTFTRANPYMAPAIQKTIALVGASSDATVARYDHAVQRYNETGNDDAIEALAPMMAQDSVALAIRNGEITQADLANGGIETALGFAPTEAMTAAAMTAPAPAAPVAAAPVATPAAPQAPAPLAATPALQRRDNSTGTQSLDAAINRLSEPTHGKSGAALASWHGLPMAYVQSQIGKAPQDVA
jgi:hypothetical protein